MTSLKYTLMTILILSINRCHCVDNNETEPDAYLTRFVAELWLEGAEVIRIIWRDCSKKLVDVKDVIDHKEYFPKFVRCMKRKTLRALDRSLTPDLVPLTEGVNLVRFEMVDRSGNIMPENETSAWTEKELEEGDWRTLALQRMAKVLKTHVIKIDFENGKSIEKVEYRGRRRHQMMTMMMFGIVSIGMVMVPMGFQFLAVLGGKALLLAKMALILASIQGLKKVELNNDDRYHDRGKIAASPINYGFYHHPYDYPYEKRSRADQDWPPPELMPVTSPPAMSMFNPWTDTETIKSDRIQIARVKKERKAVKKGKNTNNVTKAVKNRDEPRLYPIYTGQSDAPGSEYLAIDTPTALAELTTRPVDVQADYSLDLPYNRFHFQSPATIVST